MGQIVLRATKCCELLLKVSVNEEKQIPTIHVDLLAQLYELHLCWHVSHSSHAVSKVFTADEAVFVFVELFECLTQFCEQET